MQNQHFFMLLSTLLLLSACDSNPVKIGGDIVTIKISLPKSIERYEQAKKLFYDSHQHFNKSEQFYIRKELESIDFAINQAAELRNKNGLQKLTSYAFFIRYYNQAKTSYKIIQSILENKNLNAEQIAVITRLKNEAIVLDAAMSSLNAETHGENIEKIALLVDLTAEMLEQIKTFK